MNTGGCANCGQSKVVSLGGKDYCANCGALMVQAPTPTPSTAPPTPPAAPASRPISDLSRQPRTAGQIIDLRAQNGRQAVTAAAVNNPIGSPRIDLVGPSSRVNRRAELAQTTPQSSQISKFSAPAAPAATPAAAPPQILPNAAASTHQAMQKLPAAEIAPTALATPARTPLAKGSLVAAAVVIAGLGAYIWFVNYPKMAVKIAGSRAGLEASFPAFLPSSYRLSGTVAYGAGEVSYQLKSPSADKSLTVTQKQTSWDSKSLLENYVKTQTAEPLNVEGQGLTVYLYDDKATWVNHGIWYTLDGTERLNREQILKIAYSL